MLEKFLKESVGGIASKSRDLMGKKKVPPFAPI